MEYQNLSISVIIPTLNREKLLPRALESVFAQTQCPKEVIVVDNGSIDGTIPMLKRNYPEVRVFCEQKPGVSAARNFGISVAKGRWIGFLDSDDEWHPGKLEKQVGKLKEAGGHRLVHTDEVWFRRGERINQHKKHTKSGGDIFESSLKLCCISPSSALIKKTVFEALGGFDETLPACEDYDMWLRITCQEQVLFVPEPLTIKHGGHLDQLSNRYWGMDRFRIKALENLLASSELTAEQAKLTGVVLLEKLKILLSGASKRGNEMILATYTKKLKHWEGIL